MIQDVNEFVDLKLNINSSVYEDVVDCVRSIDRSVDLLIIDETYIKGSIRRLTERILRTLRILKLLFYATLKEQI